MSAQLVTNPVQPSAMGFSAFQNVVAQALVTWALSPITLTKTVIEAYGRSETSAETASEPLVAGPSAPEPTLLEAASITENMSVTAKAPKKSKKKT